MWEISEGDVKFFHAMKLVPPEDPRLMGAQSDKVLKLSMQALFNFLVLGDVSRVSGTD